MVHQVLKSSPHGNFQVTQLCENIAICEAKIDRHNSHFSHKRAIAINKKLTASRFDAGVNSCCETTVCGLSSSQHQNQLNFEEKAIYLA